MSKGHSILFVSLLLGLLAWAAESAAEPNGLRVVYDLHFDSDERGEFLSVLGTLSNDRADLSFPLELEMTLVRDVDGEILPVSSAMKHTLGENGSTFSQGSEAPFTTFFELSEIDLPRLAEESDAAKRQLERELRVRFRFSRPR